MSSKIRAILVEDEFKSRSALTKLIDKYCPSVKVIGYAETSKEAIKLINNLKPDIVFLDILLPDEDGFSVLENVTFKEFEVIFTTASDQHAVRAFEFAAIHYLLKPINGKELQQAIERFERIKDDIVFDDKLTILKQSLNNKPEKIILPGLDELNIIELDNIVRCESSKNYTIFYLCDKKFLIVSKAINTIEKLLSHLSFFRVHNQHIVNLKYIERFKKGRGGDLRLVDGSIIPVSVIKKNEFIKKLNEFALSI